MQKHSNGIIRLFFFFLFYNLKYKKYEEEVISKAISSGISCLKKGQKDVDGTQEAKVLKKQK